MEHQRQRQLWAKTDLEGCIGAQAVSFQNVLAQGFSMQPAQGLELTAQDLLLLSQCRCSSSCHRAEGLEPGKRRTAPSRIFKGLNPELSCWFSFSYLALQAVMFQGHLRFLWLIFPDAWTFFSLPINFQKSTMTLVFLPWEAWANGFPQITSKAVSFWLLPFLTTPEGRPFVQTTELMHKGDIHTHPFPSMRVSNPYF